MGSDLFGSFAESTVAALVVSGNSEDLIRGANFLYPLVISSLRILICLITSLFASFFSVKQETDGEKCRID
jgi:Na+/H+-translocating membrane pyrophosphatase